MKGLLGLLFVLLFALLLNVKLWFFPLFFVTFVFLSNVTHDNYSFLVGLSPQMTDFTMHAFRHILILPLVTSIAQYFGKCKSANLFSLISQIIQPIQRFAGQAFFREYCETYSGKGISAD